MYTKHWDAEFRDSLENDTGRIFNLRSISILYLSIMKSTRTPRVSSRVT